MSSDSPVQSQDPEERLQVVDQEDRPSCGMPRREVHAGSHPHRAVHVLVFKRNGDLYLQRRSQAKETWPGFWDSSCSGHVLEDESYEEAAARELNEELGLSGSLECVGKIPACEETENEFVTVYAMIYDGPITPNEAEIDEGRFVSADQVRLELKNAPQRFTPSFAKAFFLHATSSPTIYFEE